MSEEMEIDYEELAEEIREDRALPYTLTVEKIEDGIIWTHNQWGNHVKYIQVEDEHGHIHYEIYQE